MALSSFSYSSSCAPELSPTKDYIAYISGTSLVVRNTTSSAVKRLFHLSGLTGSVHCIRWDPLEIKQSKDGNNERRLAIASRTEIQIFSLDKDDDKSPIGTILPGKHGIQDIQWVSFETEDNGAIVRLAVIGEELSDITFWSSDGIDMEIFDSKHGTIFDRYAYSVSILTRSGTLDCVESIISTPSGIEKMASIPLKSVLDAHTVIWSPSGLYLAVADTYAAGYSVTIWGCDGSLLRTYSGPNSTLHEIAGIGVRTLAWISHNDRELLLIGDCEDQVAVLDVQTNRCMALLMHGTIYNSTPVWEEYMTTDYSMVYKARQLPFKPAKVKGDKPGFVPGISTIAVAPGGKYIATISDNTPNLIWIWDCHGDTFSLSCVICQSSPVHSMEWNTLGTSLLFLPTGSSTSGIWDSSTLVPHSLEWNELEGSLINVSWCTVSEEKVVIGRTSREFAFLTLDSTNQIHESESLLHEDDTNVINIMTSVRQNEEIENTSRINDTFSQVKC